MIHGPKVKFGYSSGLPETQYVNSLKITVLVITPYGISNSICFLYEPGQKEIFPLTNTFNTII